MFVDRDRGPQPSALRHVAEAEARDVGRRPADQLLAPETNGAARRRREPNDRLAQGRLAHAVAPDQRQDAVLQRQIDTLQRVASAIEDVSPLISRRLAGRRSGMTATQIQLLHFRIGLDLGRGAFFEVRPLCIIVTLSTTRSATSMSCSMMM